MNQLLTKDDVVNKLRHYAESPDDDVIRFKQLVYQSLSHSVELLYALNVSEYESLLFDEDGNIKAEYDENGNLIPQDDWDAYFEYYIRPYLCIPETQETSHNILCYTFGFTEMPRYNDVLYYPNITFTILVDNKDAIDKNTGIARHDLIGSILRERFNWSNVFGCQCDLVSNRESVTDTNYITRTMVFQSTKPKGIVKTDSPNGSPRIINRIGR